MMDTGLTREQSELIKRTLLKKAGEDEFQMFIAQCNRTGLDPFSRQIYAVWRRERTADGRWEEKMMTQVSIDGLRLIAERSGKYAGQVGPFWCGDDGVWKEVWLDSHPPRAAKVGILRSDFKEPLFAVARFETYKQEGKEGPNPFWRKMPDLMVGKCSEALALRRAFPQEMSGLYISEEIIDQTPPAQQHPQSDPAQVEPPAPVSNGDRIAKSIELFASEGVKQIALELYLDKPISDWDKDDLRKLGMVWKQALAGNDSYSMKDRLDTLMEPSLPAEESGAPY